MSIDQNTRSLMKRAIGFLQDERMGKNDRVKYSLDLLGLLSDALKKDPVPASEFDAFRSSYSSLLAGELNRDGIFGYTMQCGIYAERGRLDGFAEACGMRSILQLLNDKFVNWNEVESESLKNTFTEDIEDIDETLEDVSDEAPPVPEEDIPDWAPDSHWWWRAPKRQNMSEAERKARLEYDHLDGVYD